MHDERMGLLTQLPELLDMNLSRLRDLDGDELEAEIERTLQQIAKPRTNLGSSGPPGRTD